MPAADRSAPWTDADSAHGASAGPWICPACRGALAVQPAGWACAGCGRSFPVVAGLPDLRLAPDRYLSLEAERAKAERLAERDAATDVLGLAGIYYGMTADVDARRRARFLAHIAGAETRGETLATLLPRAGRILEVGCGTGGLLVAAARAGLDIRGVDLAVRWLVVARRRLRDRGLTVPLVGASADRLPWPDGAFNAVVADSVLEHLDDPGAAVREWCRVLRPGGRLLAWSPNRFALATDPHVGLWGVGWLPRAWAPGYVRRRLGLAWTVRPLSPTEAGSLAASAGFGAVRVEAPAIPDRWARGRAVRPVIRAYGIARRLPVARDFVRAFGPLWELRAVRGGAA